MMQELRELSGEVHSILSSRENVRQSVRSSSRQDDVAVRRDRDDPVGSQADEDRQEGHHSRAGSRALV